MSLRIAIMGTRGVPASYSGFETCAEQLGSRLVERGHQVTVYCRSHHVHYEDDVYKGMRLVKLPTLATKHLDTIVHTFLSSLHALGQRYDVVLYFGVGNAVVTWMPRLTGTRTILNVNGLDWKREKWSLPAKKFLQLSEFLSGLLPNVHLTDSRSVQSLYRERYRKEPRLIAYGSEVDIVQPGSTLQRFGLTAHKYVLFVGRLVPENRVDHLVEAFLDLDTDLRCVIVGDAAYARDYIESLKHGARRNPRIVFTGYVFGRGYFELGSNALIFVETSEVGGTHPALLEAMAFGQCVVVNDTAENLETIGDAGLSYSGNEGSRALRERLQELLENPRRIQEYRKRARQRAESVYSWGKITQDYEDLMRELL